MVCFVVALLCPTEHWSPDLRLGRHIGRRTTQNIGKWYFFGKFCNFVWSLLGSPATLQIIGDTISDSSIMYQTSGARAVPLAGPVTDLFNSWATSGRSHLDRQNASGILDCNGFSKIVKNLQNHDFSSENRSCQIDSGMLLGRPGWARGWRERSPGTSQWSQSAQMR